MNFCFPEEHERFRAVVRTVLEDRSPLGRVLERADSSGGLDDELWGLVQTSGWTRIGIPEEHGGDGGGYLELAVLAEELGRSLAPVPAFPSMFLAGPLLVFAADAPTRSETLAAMANGSIATCAMPLQRRRPKLAMSEGHVSGTVVAPALSSASFLLLTAPEALSLVDLRDRSMATEVQPTLDITQPLEQMVLEDTPCHPLGGLATQAAGVDLALCGGLVLLAFEQLGGARRSLALAVEHAKSRRQFGHAIGSFQAIKHRLADMAVAVELAAANALYGLLTLEQHVTRAASGARVPLERGALRDAAYAAFTHATETYQMVARESLHIHGGSGFTWEGAMHLFLRRSQGRALLAGGLSQYRRAIGGSLVENGVPPAARAGTEQQWTDVDDGTTISLADTEDQATFRREVRQWLSGRLPPNETRPAGEQGRATTIPHAQRYDPQTIATARAWQATKASSQWAGLTWPTEQDGRGLSPMHQLVWDEEEAAFITPPNLFGIATRVVGPTIIGHGTRSQRERFLPAILNGTHIWCLLLSEPDAGSDLQSLTTSAAYDEDTGTWVLNGQKTWVSGAQSADYTLVLARTSPRERGAPGLTLFALHMRQPAVTVAPIRQIVGTSLFCNVFLDGARVPDSDRVGERDGGWSVMTTSFANERLFIATRSESDASSVLGRLVRLAQTSDPGGSPVGTDPLVQEQLGSFAIRAAALRNIEYRIVSALSGDRLPGLEGSMAKLANGALVQEMAAFGLEILARTETVADASKDARRHEAEWFETFLRSPSFRIGGGTDEIQRTIIGERMLGLPRS